MELLNISPIDGRYHEKTKELADYFSEYALIKYRVTVEIKWLLYLMQKKIINENIKEKNQEDLLNVISNFSIDDAVNVKEIEKNTKHDVKAIEYFLQNKLTEIKLTRLIPFIHITLTSEDVNNTSYNLMVTDGIKIYLNNLNDLINQLDNLAIKYKSCAMLSHTHGQKATSTTIGKEMKVFSYRLKSIVKLIKELKLRSKFSGTVGNYNAHVIAYPNIDWINITKEFVNSLGLEYNPVTTQIESHDILCILLSYIKVINNIIKDLNSDMWLYLSYGYFKERKKVHEVGSSVMPHKVNPINHENSMANIEISNGLIDALVTNLSISRMQRDLSDSSKLRNLGVIFSHSLISIKETISGLNKIIVNKEYLQKELEQHYEILTEAIQTVLRKNKVPNAYELLKQLSRGKTLSKKQLHIFINSLPISDDDRQRLLSLTPNNYIGLSTIIVEKN